MGSWGITMRQSDYGLDLLDTIVKTQLKKVDFSTFNVAEAISLLRQEILDEIKRANRGCSPEKMDCYINENFPENFTQAALLVAECLADYYRTGGLTVTEYVGRNYDQVDHRITDFTVTKDDLQSLLDELRRVQDPENPMYKSWFRDSVRKEWLAHIRSVQQVLEKHGGIHGKTT